MPSSPARSGPRPRRLRQRLSGVLVAFAFAVVMISGTLPIPLYRQWSASFGFGPLMITVVFVAYVFGVLAALLGLGSMSDRVGRRPMLLLALLLSAASAAAFITAHGVLLLLVGRVLCGLATGVATSTATAALSETIRSPRRAAAVAAVVNLGGLGTGVLIAGAFVQYLPDPTHLVFEVYTGTLVVGLVAVALTVETVSHPLPPVRTVRRPLIPDGTDARRIFVGAGLLVAAGFGVNGFFSSLVPQFIRETLGVSNELLVACGVALIFLVALIPQLLIPARVLRGAATTLVVLLAGTVLLDVALSDGSPALFVTATTIAGTGVGMAFRRGLTVTEHLAGPSQRAGMNATYFIAAYLGLIAPTVTLGALTQTLGSTVAVGALVVIVAATAVTGTMLTARGRTALAAQNGTP